MKMKKRALFTVGLLALASVILPAHAKPTGCAAKKQEIEQQIDYAKQHNNAARIAGLQKALSEVNDHCTDSGLLKERQQRMAEKQQKVSERQHELADAQQDGNLKKIDKKRKKLEEAREELQEAQAALHH